MRSGQSRCGTLVLVALLLMAVAQATALAGDLGTGPAPDLTAPDATAVAVACEALAEGRTLTRDQTTSLLGWTVFHARQGVLAYIRQFAGDRPVSLDEAFGPESLAGHCELGSMLCTFILEDLGFPRERLWWCNAERTFGENPHYHGFLVVETSDGGTWLVDPTFRQFLAPDGFVGRPGRILDATEEGRDLARRLCRDGFVALDDDLASLYGRSLGGIEDGARRFPLARIRACNREPMPFTRLLVGEGILPEPPLRRRSSFLRLWAEPR